RGHDQSPAVRRPPQVALATAQVFVVQGLLAGCHLPNAHSVGACAGEAFAVWRPGDAPEFALGSAELVFFSPGLHVPDDGAVAVLADARKPLAVGREAATPVGNLVDRDLAEELAVCGVPGKGVRWV